MPVTLAVACASLLTPLQVRKQLKSLSTPPFEKVDPKQEPLSKRIWRARPVTLVFTPARKKGRKTEKQKYIKKKREKRRQQRKKQGKQKATPGRGPGVPAAAVRPGPGAAGRLRGGGAEAWDLRLAQGRGRGLRRALGRWAAGGVGGWGVGGWPIFGGQSVDLRFVDYYYYF